MTTKFKARRMFHFHPLFQRWLNSIFIQSLLILPVLNTGSVQLSWDPNQENDLAGYIIYYGQASQNYSSTVQVGNQTSHRVSGLEVGRRYYFAVTAVDFSGNESLFSNEVSAVIPADGEEAPPDGAQTLMADVYNFPNPFRINQSSTTIRYELATAAQVTIEILDVDNKLVKTLVEDEFKRQGEHLEDIWDGTNSKNELVANGVYFCRIKAPNVQRFIKIAVTR
ncbi:MAG: fibronectin type III domain-containing protein [bacterium]